MIRLSKKAVFITSCFILSLFLFSLFLKNQKPAIKKNKNYILPPLITNSDLYCLDKIPDYPFVSTKVGSSKYFMTNVLELINQRQTNQNTIVYTYVGKRISELEKWGKDIPVLGEIYSLHQLTSWWSKQKPAWWQIYKLRNFNSWEASLARYLFLWKKEIKMINLTEPKYLSNNIMTLKGYLRNHQRKIDLIIYNSNKSQQEKKYLFNLTNEIYTYLNKQLNSYIPEYSLSTIDYSLSNLRRDKKYGVYNLSLIMEDFPSYLNTNPSLKINNRIILGEPADENFISFKNIIINDESRNLELKPNSVHFPVKENRWLKSYNDQKKQYQYILSIPRIPGELTYFLHFQYQFNQPVILQIIKDEKGEKNGIEQVIFSNDLLPINQKTVLNEPLTFPDINNTNYQFLLISYQPLSENEIKSIQIDFLPFLEPEILLEKIGNISYSLPPIRYKTNINPTKIFTIFFSGITILLLFFTFNWLLKIISKKFRLKAKNSYSIALVLLVFCAFSTLFHNEAITEKLAIWFYLFLIVSVAQSMLSLRTEAKTNIRRNK